MTILRYSGGANVNGGGGRGGGHYSKSTAQGRGRGRGSGGTSSSNNNRSYSRSAPPSYAAAPVAAAAAATGGGARVSHSWTRPKTNEESPTTSNNNTKNNDAQTLPQPHYPTTAASTSAIIHEQQQYGTNNFNNINRLDSKQSAAIKKSPQQSTPFPALLTVGTDDSTGGKSSLQSMETFTASTATLAQSPTGEMNSKQNNNDATVGETPTAAATTATRGPILKGPKSYSYVKTSASQSASSSYSRKRSVAAAHIASSHHHPHGGSSAGISSSNNSRQGEKTKASQHNNNSFSWKRADGNGSNTAAPTSNEAQAACSQKPLSAPAPAPAACSQEPMTVESPHESEQQQQQQQDSTKTPTPNDHDKASATNPLHKVGAYKLVHKKDKNDGMATVPKSPTKRSGFDNGNSSNIRRSHHKKPPLPPHHYSLQKQKRAAVVSSSTHGAKRIKISAAAPVENDGIKEDERHADNDGQGRDDDSNVQKEKGKPIATVEKTLTDFAYASSRRGVTTCATTTGQGRRLHKRSRRTRANNNTLVRVQPDEAKTPICPTFLRGLPCTEERCLQRHDIPKEFAMPVCSYFQKHGMCMKGNDCPFRHVKLNSLYLVPCPSFSILGYCPDLNCPMMHTRTKKTMIVNNNKEKQRTTTTTTTTALPKDHGNDSDNDVESSDDDDDDDESDAGLVFYDD